MTSSTTMQTVILKVGLHCEGCERRVKKAIWQLRGITSVDVDTKQERVTVTGFVDPAKVLKAVKKTGKSVEIYNNKYQAVNNKIPYVVTPTKFGNAGGGESKTTPDSKKHSHQQFPNSTKNKQQQPRHTQSDYYSDADSDYGSSFPKVRQSSNKFNDSSNNKSDKDQKSSFKNHTKLQSQYQEEFDFDDFESDEENDSSYGHQKSSFYNPKSAGGFDNSSNPKSSLKQTAGFPGFGTQKQSSQTDFEYSGSKSPHSGYPNNSHSKSQSLYGYVPNNGNEHKSSTKSPYGHASGNNNEQLKSQNKSSYGYAPNTHNEHQNSHGNGNKSQYPVSYSDNKPQKKPQQQQKFVSFDDEYEPQQQPKYRPEPQLVKQQRSSNRDDEYGYEQKFYTAYGQEQNYRPTYSYTYHEPSYRLPPATGGFSTMFSEENPNACSIM